MRNDAGKLDQLTSLRFFAAMMIVIHHSVGLFGIGDTGLNLGQGVSFFFVLSGFILTYVYPKLDEWPAVKRFWRARIGRIWPAHAASFVLGFWLVSYTWDTGTAVANLLMVQAWIPQSAFYFSYNAVAWSVSTESFFYLVFPILVYRLDKTWWRKLLLSGAVLIALMAISNGMSLREYGDPGTPKDGFLVTQHGLLYINPVARIFEFIIGMCVALAWRRTAAIRWNPHAATACEVGAIALCAASMHYVHQLAGWSQRSILGAPAALWTVHSESVFAFALLVFVMAQGRGKISGALAHPFLVLLGEISFSIYLIHQILLTWYRMNIDSLFHLANPVAYAVYLGVLLLSSYLMWACIEMPGRRLIVGQGPIHGTTVLTRSWRERLAVERKALFAGIALACIVGFIQFTKEMPEVVVMAKAGSAAERETLIGAPSSCNIEAAAGIPFATSAVTVSRKTIVVSGWFLSAVSKNTGVPAALVLRDEADTMEWSGQLGHWYSRPDVIGTGDAGFRKELDLGAIAPGRYRLLLTFSEAGSTYICDKGRVLEVR